MPSPLLRRACAATLGGLLAVTLLAGCSTVADPVGADALSGAATATLARSSAIRCAGDSTSSPAKSKLVGYSALAGNTFAKREAKAGGKVLTVGKVIALANFKAHAATYDGAVIGDGADGIRGTGIKRTTIRMVTRSSTRASEVPHTSPKTNQISVLRLVGAATVLRSFTLQGTAQGHIYNGIRVEKVRDLRADHVRVLGIPGNDHQPPGETFAINDFRTTGSQWSHIRIDGRGVGATGFGVNSSKRIRICDAVSKNNPTGMGFAFWQSSGITCVDCRAYGNGFSGFNFERTSGTVTLTRPDASGNKYDMRIASDQGSAKFRVIDPVLHHGVWTIWMPRTWYVKNTQKQSDITLTVHGEQRNDLLRIRTY